MASSLRDQLVKAGLATASQAKRSERQQRAEEQARRKGNKGGKGDNKGDKKAGQVKQPDAADPRNVRERAKQLTAQKSERDRSIASERNEKAAAKALRAEIKQIILQNDQRAKETSDADVPYNFVHGKKIKRIYVPSAQKELLSSGALMIVNNDGLYHFVPRKVADQIAARDPRRIIVANDAADNGPDASLGEDDEHYSKFAVPDDLDW